MVHGHDYKKSHQLCAYGNLDHPSWKGKAYGQLTVGVGSGATNVEGFNPHHVYEGFKAPKPVNYMVLPAFGLPGNTRGYSTLQYSKTPGCTPYPTVKAAYPPALKNGYFMQQC